jgi:hypothetical protein
MCQVAHGCVCGALALVCLTVSGCSANQAYEPIFQDLVASIRRVNTAMLAARDKASVKKAVDTLTKETQTIDDLRSKLRTHGKPNPASKKAMVKFLQENEAVMKDEVSQAATQFGKAVAAAGVSTDDRMMYMVLVRKFAEAIELFGIEWNLLGK